jgi:hypothetical protein
MPFHPRDLVREREHAFTRHLTRAPLIREAREQRTERSPHRGWSLFSRLLRRKIELHPADVMQLPRECVPLTGDL